MSKIRPRNLASVTTLIGIFSRMMFASGKIHTAGESGFTPSLKLGTENRFQHPILNAVNAQLHSPFHSVQ